MHNDGNWIIDWAIVSLTIRINDFKLFLSESVILHANCQADNESQTQSTNSRRKNSSQGIRKLHMIEVSVFSEVPVGPPAHEIACILSKKSPTEMRRDSSQDGWCWSVRLTDVSIEIHAHAYVYNKSTQFLCSFLNNNFFRNNSRNVNLRISSEFELWTQHILWVGYLRRTCFFLLWDLCTFTHATDSVGWDLYLCLYRRDQETVVWLDFPNRIPSIQTLDYSESALRHLWRKLNVYDKKCVN